MAIVEKIIQSWATVDGHHGIDEILDWVREKNESLTVRIQKESLERIQGWFMDEDGVIKSHNGSFFSIHGFKKYGADGAVEEQPIILQNEIGYLGIICKEIDGVLHFLMQAKIEPGNINKIQISPTIQATKSNFEQKHGGKRPAYLDFFLQAEKYEIVVDQIQSEQAERFYKKRNRNILIYVGDEDVEVLPSHKWMTLGQIKALMKIDNLVNMDTRTVLSCIPFALYQDEGKACKEYFANEAMYYSLFNDDGYGLVSAFRKINNYKMFHEYPTAFCSLHDLQTWKMENGEFVSKTPNNFKVVFCNLEIEGREVRSWGQPLFEATGIALFVLFVAKFGNKYKFLVRLKPESGSFDKVELGPTIQNEWLEKESMPVNRIEALYLSQMQTKQGVLHDVLLSEEGGRFYREQNQNVVMLVDEKEVGELPEDYMWLDYKTLNLMQQTNNVLNIQLRNLLSLLEC